MFLIALERSRTLTASLFVLACLFTLSPACYAQTNARMLTTPNAQTGTSYQFVAADTTRVTTFNNASPVAVTLPSGATLGFGPGTMLSVINLGAGTVTITCSNCTINGAVTLVLAQNQGADIYGGYGSPTVNYIALPSLSGASGLPAGPSGTLQCTNGLTFSACSETDNGTNFSTSLNARFKGPNPYVDITSYGARAGNVNLAPIAAGITATCSGTTTTLTLSSASTFVNGDGISAYGCGPTPSITTPGAVTVTPVLAKAGTGTGIVVNGPTGATTYNYKVTGRDALGGQTAASTVATTTTGAASLGNQQVNITSCSRSNNVVTCITASAHGLVAGAQIKIGAGNSLSDGSFYGRHVVNSTADNTHFVYLDSLDTRQGASTASTGGVLIWYNANHITWASSGSAAVEYFIYSDRANPGTFALIGRSMPQGTNTDLTFDDFGSPMMDNQIFPAYVPTTAPSSPVNGNLNTTIVSGGGSTTLTVANAASQSVSGVSIRLSSGPALLAAFTAASANGSSVYIPIDPSGGSFPINSYIDVQAFPNVNVMQSGGLYSNETIACKCQWYGDRSAVGNNTSGPGIWRGNPAISVNAAHPALYNSLLFGVVLQGVTFSNGGSVNGILGALYEGGFNMAFTQDYFFTGSGNNDYMGIGLYLRGSAGQSATNVIIDQDGFAPGGPVSDSGSQTPVFYCNLCGQGQVRSAYYVHRGGQINGVASGGGWKIDHSYINGGSTPLYTFSGYTNNWGAILNLITLDTIAEPCIFAASAGAVAFPSGGVCTPSSPANGLVISGVEGLPIYILGGVGNTPQVSPNVSAFGPVCQGGASDGIFGSNYSTYCNNIFDTALSTGVNYPIFVNSAPHSAPTCAVSAGGSLAIGSYQFVIVPVWQNGGEGSYSPASLACTTTTGNQTITISNLGGFAGNPKSQNLYYCVSNGTNCTSGFAAANTFGDPLAASTTSLVWSSFALNSFASNGALPSGGPTMLMPGMQGIATPGITLAGNPFGSGVQTSAGTNFGTNLSTQTVIASMPQTQMVTVNIATTQSLAGAGCGAGANTVFATLAWTAPGNTAETITLGTLSISANGAVDSGVATGTTTATSIVAKAGTAVTYTTTSVLNSAGCSPIPQYTIYAKATF